MELVSIREASHRLHLSTANVRECIRAGELKAYRNPDPDGRSGWVVELPEEGWTSAARALELSKPFSPWWWANAERTGDIHYVVDLFASSFEEMVPRFLCGFESENIWAVVDLSIDLICSKCLAEATAQGIEISI